MMDGAAVKELATRLRGPVDLNGFILRPNDWTVSDPASLIAPGPSAKTLPVSTLGAIRDYLAANKDALDLTRIVVHVVGPHRVDVLGPLDTRARVRETFTTATVSDMTDGFLGKYQSLEDFLIGLQVRFADADDRKRVLSLLSSVKHESVKSALDDGMTQVVQVRAGVALVSEVAVPNPILLCAYRTFRDIVQPSSLFVLRVKEGDDDELPQVALFEADGGAWRLVATERIRAWLADAAPTAVVLA